MSLVRIHQIEQDSSVYTLADRTALQEIGWLLWGTPDKSVVIDHTAV